MALQLGEIAQRIGAELHGDPGCAITGVATLDRARAGQLSFLYDRRYRRFLNVTAASAVILRPADLEACTVSALVTEDPYLCYARAATLLHPPPEFPGGVDETARVAPDAAVDAGAWIGPNAVIEAGAQIGDRAFVGPGCVIGAGVRIGDYTRLIARVTVVARATIGRRCLIHPGAVIGADGFGFAPDGGIWVKVPQLGSVQIGDEVEIGANTTIDRGALKDTVIGTGVKLDNQIQIGHNCRIGDHTAIAGCVGVSGSTRIGKRCMIGGGAGIAGHLEIADGVVIKAAASVTKSIPRPGVYSSVWPAREDSEWRRRVARFNRLCAKVRAVRPQEQSGGEEGA